MTVFRTHLAGDITRREFLGASGRFLTGMLFADATAAALFLPPPLLRFGMIADVHYADAPSRNNRYFRESIAKMDECVAVMNREKADFLVELGDFKDAGSPPGENGALGFLEAIERRFAEFKGPRYHVVGNHDVDAISKGQFYSKIKNGGIAPSSGYYSFGRSGCLFIVLDANYAASGKEYCRGDFQWDDSWLPPSQLEWLERQLSVGSGPVIVFIHQTLDGETSFRVKNAEAARGILRKSGRVAAVFQGHYHQGNRNSIDGIHYYTLRAVVDGSGMENSAYAIVELNQNASLTVIGYRRAEGATLGVKG